MRKRKNDEKELEEERKKTRKKKSKEFKDKVKDMDMKEDVSLLQMVKNYRKSLNKNATIFESCCKAKL